MEILRWALANHRNDWTAVGLVLSRGHDLPPAWLPGVHDKALAKVIMASAAAHLKPT